MSAGENAGQDVTFTVSLETLQEIFWNGFTSGAGTLVMHFSPDMDAETVRDVASAVAYQAISNEESESAAVRGILASVSGTRPPDDYRVVPVCDEPGLSNDA